MSLETIAPFTDNPIAKLPARGSLASPPGLTTPEGHELARLQVPLVW